MSWQLPWRRGAGAAEPVLDDDAIRQALEHRLVRHACVYQQKEGVGSLRHLRASTPDLYVRINGRQLAYVHHWCLSGDGKSVTVGHFAVEKEFTGKGFGRALARGFAKSLREAFDTEAIVFGERGYSAAHQRFFERLGARPRANSLYPGKPDWIWSFPANAAD